MGEVSVGEFVRSDCDAASSGAFASPKSRTFTCPFVVSATFAGLRSRAPPPSSCAASRGSGNLPRDPNRVVKRQRALFEPLGERRAFDELEHEKARALLLLESMDLRDVRMIEWSEDR